MTERKRKNMLIYLLMVMTLRMLSTQFSFTADYIDTQVSQEQEETIKGTLYKMPIIRTFL